MRYYLLLSDPELKQTIERLETLCAIEVDVKDMNKPKKGKVKQLCRYLRERVRPDKVETRRITRKSRKQSRYGVCIYRKNTPPPLSLLYVRTAQLPDLQK